MIRFLLLMVCSCLLFQASVTAQVPVSLSGQLDGWPEGSVISLFSYQGYLIDTTRLGNSSFSLNEDLPGGDYYMLKVGRQGQATDSVLLYLDSGRVQLSYTRKEKASLHFSGSLYAADLENLVRLQQHAGNSFTASVPGWVSSHRGSPVSVFALDRYLAICERKADWRLIDSLYSLLTDSAKNNILALRLGLDIERNNTLVAGNPFPAFQLPDTHGKIIDNSLYAGKFVLVDFWASWCGPCREENKNFSRLAKKYRNKNFQLVSISLDKDPVSWKAAILQDGLSWLQLSNSLFPHDPLDKALNLKLIPVDFLLDKKGNILGKALYGSELEAELDRLLN